MSRCKSKEKVLCKRQSLTGWISIERRERVKSVFLMREKARPNPYWESRRENRHRKGSFLCDTFISGRGGTLWWECRKRELRLIALCWPKSVTGWPKKSDHWDPITWFLFSSSLNRCIAFILFSHRILERWYGRKNFDVNINDGRIRHLIVPSRSFRNPTWKPH